MSDAPVLTIDLTKEQSISTILPHPPLLTSERLGWSRINVQYHHQPASESPEHIPKQHLIVHYPGQERARTERYLAGCRRREDLVHGSCAIVPANLPHSVNWDRGLEFTFLILDPSYLVQVAHETVDGDRVELIPQFAKIDRVVSSIGFALKAELQTGGSGGRLYVESATSFLTAHLLRHYCIRTQSFKDYAGGLPKYKLREAIAYIQEHLGEEISLEAIASHLKMSQYYFCHLFKQSMGVSPYQYVLRQRIDRAKQLLKQRQLAITDVALECGFANQTHFTKHFRKLTGTTPRAYREQ